MPWAAETCCDMRQGWVTYLLHELEGLLGSGVVGHFEVGPPDAVLYLERRSGRGMPRPQTAVTGREAQDNNKGHNKSCIQRWMWSRADVPSR